MLDDAPRKLLRILVNLNYIPSLAELSRKSGRTPGRVKMALRILAAERFIEWDPDHHSELKVIRAWEYEFASQPAMKWWEHD